MPKNGQVYGNWVLAQTRLCHGQQLVKVRAVLVVALCQKLFAQATSTSLC